MEPGEVAKILQHDDYVEVQRHEVLAGDTIIYYGEDDGDLEHSGVVLEPPRAETLWVPTVFSKWGAGSEAVHAGNDCPYFFGAVRYYRVSK